MKIKSILITVVLSIAILCSAVYPLGFISAQTAQNRVQLEQQIIQLLNQIIVQLRGELALILSQQSTSPILVQSVGQYSGFYNFPSSFFSQTYVSEDQMVKITDGQYLGLKDMHNGISPYNFCRIEYSPAVYGATTSSGIKLGDSAFSGLNSSNPRWAVMGHEQGHNFFGGTSQFYMTMSAPGPFLQESLAVLSSFYAYHYILDNSDSLDINQIGLYSLNADMATERAYQESMYNQYVSGGNNFDENNVLTSQALDYKMITYGEQYGWVGFKKLSEAFSDSASGKFTFQNDGVSDIERSTYVVAALSASFNKDLRQDFRNLNFLIDDALYTQIYSTLHNNI